MSKIVGYAPGAYDLFHIGHLNVLRHAKSQCDHLIAGVVSDEMLELTKGTTPFIPLTERLEIVKHIQFVDEVHAETVPDKLDTWEVLRFDRIFKGDDWRGHGEGRQAGAGLRPGRRRSRLLPLHDAHLEHAAEACAGGSGRFRTGSAG